MNIKDLHEMAQSLFSERVTLMSLWQELADNFYPERADFTFQRTIGTDYAAGLMTSYPVLVRRDLGDQFDSMLRPMGKEWAHITLRDPELEDNETKRYMEWATKVQRRAMYDPVTKFTQATKEGDHDYAAFGQCVISVRLNRMGDALLYRTYHLRDVAWAENAERDICMVFRKWKPKARDLQILFKDKISAGVQQVLTQNKPLTEIECMHMIVEADLYDDHANGKPYWSLVYDVQNQHLMEATPVWSKEYVIPRWQTVSGSQYAFSPASIVGLADARLLQAMTWTLLEAGEKVVNPPMVGTHDVVRSDVAVMAGGITWVDRDYDERLGEALRPMTIDAKGMPLGQDMMRDSRSMLAAAFFLNKLSLPQRGPEMTAYEVGQRIQQYIRDALPLFSPMESNYNGQLCEETFQILLRNGAFGPLQSMPRRMQAALMQKSMSFRFESPLHDAIEAQKGAKFLEMQQLLTQAVAIDRRAAAIPDIMGAFRDALGGVGVPAKWINSESTVLEALKKEEQQQQAQQLLAAAEQASGIAGNLADAQKANAEAGALAPA